MLKKLLLAVMVAAPMCLFAEVKIGTVDTQEVFTLMPELKTAQASLEEVNKRYQTEYKSLQDEFNKNLYFPFHLPGNLYAKDQRLLFLFTVFISNVITLYTNCYHLSTICFKYNKNSKVKS